MAGDRWQDRRSHHDIATAGVGRLPNVACQPTRARPPAPSPAQRAPKTAARAHRVDCKFVDPRSALLVRRCRGRRMGVVFRGERSEVWGGRLPKAPRNTMAVLRPHRSLIRPEGGSSFVSHVFSAPLSANAPNQASALPKSMLKARRGWGCPLFKTAAGCKSGRPRPTTAERASRTPGGWSRGPPMR